MTNNTEESQTQKNKQQHITLYTLKRKTKLYKKISKRERDEGKSNKTKTNFSESI
mgnify:CR=1